MWPKKNCEKITVYNDSGAPSTEYRHFIRQYSSHNAATDLKNKSTPKNSDSKQHDYYVDDNHVDTDKIRASQTATDSRNFYGHRMDSGDTLVSNVYDSKAVQNTIGSSGTVIMDKTGNSEDIIYSNDRNYGKTDWNGHFTYEAPQKKQSNGSPVKNSPSGQSASRNLPMKSFPPDQPPRGPSDHSPSRNIPEPTSSTYYVDENYVDTNKARQLQNNTDSRNFYGHSVDSKNTLVGNVYDSTATQNTIGTSGKIFKDHMTDSTDVIYSNDRLYGKTGWNGKFIYEKPKPKDKPRT
ncbi:unnamed protein product [Ceutorhynchus assimilis]|uniref:Uncharacterized protein n=1 Tax=Ceutorhynchus assimilis TaxID=467358 RepID=A0A9P0DD28_9CUCU|nr:unnamed protein product [Ceutorhynchus assimilis]